MSKSTKFNGIFSLESNSLEKRKKECTDMCMKYPDRVPVLVSRVKNSTAPQIDKQKYLVPNELTVSQFMFVVRKRIKFPQEKALFLFIDGTIPSGSTMMSALYETHKSKDDGFLRISYTEENVFG
jgi:GABA(A) receptor-associated protein